jgi:hypothetical protein
MQSQNGELENIPKRDIDYLPKWVLAGLFAVKCYAARTDMITLAGGNGIA